MTWVQPRGDSSRRVEIPYATTANQGWEVDGAYTRFEGRRYPVGARKNHVTETWTITTVWPTDVRTQAEDLLALLRDVLFEADSRLDVHINPPTNGTDVNFVGEVREVPQELGAGATTVELTFRRVDDSG